jgi:hypothetical protein
MNTFEVLVGVRYTKALSKRCMPKTNHYYINKQKIPTELLACHINFNMISHKKGFINPPGKSGSEASKPGVWGVRRSEDVRFCDFEEFCAVSIIFANEEISSAASR